MPFTVAHAAAVLPLSRLSKSRLPMSALMIGAMAPDFAYFLPGWVSRLTTHDLPGIFQFSWPVGLLVWLVYVLLLERPTIALLPDAWRTRLAPTGPIKLSLLVFASLAIMLGTATHIIWDSFTHASTPVVDALPTLHEVRFQIGRWNLPLFSLLQYLSSVIGMLLLGIWALMLLRLPQLAPSQIVPAVSMRTRLAAAVALIGSSSALALLYFVLNPGGGLQGSFFWLAIGAMTGWALAWCAVAVWIQLSERPATANATP